MVSLDDDWLVEGGLAALGDGWLVEGPDGITLIFSSCANSAALDSRRASDSTQLCSHTLYNNKNNLELA